MKRNPDGTPDDELLAALAADADLPELEDFGRDRASLAEAIAVSGMAWAFGSRWRQVTVRRLADGTYRAFVIEGAAYVDETRRAFANWGELGRWLLEHVEVSPDDDDWTPEDVWPDPDAEVTYGQA